MKRKIHASVAATVIGGLLVLAPVGNASAVGVDDRQPVAASPQGQNEGQSGQPNLSVRLAGPRGQAARTEDEAYKLLIGEEVKVTITLRNEGDALLKNVSINDIRYPQNVEVVERSCGRHDSVFSDGQSTVSLDVNEAIVCAFRLKASTPGVGMLNMTAVARNDQNQDARKNAVFVINSVEADQPAPAQPEADQPAPAQPEADQPAPAQPEADQPAPAQPEADQPAPAQPEADQPAPAQPGAGSDATMISTSAQGSHVKTSAQAPKKTARILAKTGSNFASTLSAAGTIAAVGIGTMALRRRVFR